MDTTKNEVYENSGKSSLAKFKEFLQLTPSSNSMVSNLSPPSLECRPNSSFFSPTLSRHLSSQTPLHSIHELPSPVARKKPKSHLFSRSFRKLKPTRRQSRIAFFNEFDSKELLSRLKVGISSLATQENLANDTKEDDMFSFKDGKNATVPAYLKLPRKYKATPLLSNKQNPFFE